LESRETRRRFYRTERRSAKRHHKVEGTHVSDVAGKGKGDSLNKRDDSKAPESRIPNQLFLHFGDKDATSCTYKGAGPGITGRGRREKKPKGLPKGKAGKERCL